MFASNTSQVSNDVKYIEDFFSAWLRTGTGSSQTVTTGIKENTGALVISKSRSAATDWAWYDTFRGATKDLVSNSTAAETTQSQGLTAFNTDGHTWGTLAKVNTNGATYVDFVLKPTPKFFDVVTFTINGASSNQQVAHNLGSTPGCIFVKASGAAGDWFVYHNATGNNNVLFLNGTQAASAETGAWSTSSTNFGIKSSALFGGGLTGKTAVAYLFAHNAGGFGLTGTDNVISCGSYTGTGAAGNTITLGYEPQWLLIKNTTDGTLDWRLMDTMRGMPVGSADALLMPNLSSAELSSNYACPTATGFTLEVGNANVNRSGDNYIYIAIRRGPMKVPTDGTKVFAPVAQAGGGTVTTNFPVDLSINRNRGATGANWMDRLRGGSSTTYNYLLSTSTAAEVTGSGAGLGFDNNTGYVDNGWWSSGQSVIYENFRRAPGFFDEVCYTGTGVNTTAFTHNLGVPAELAFIKRRNSSAYSWQASYVTGQIGRALDTNEQLISAWNYVKGSTSTSFTVTSDPEVNSSGATYVAYLFASCPGVQSIQSYVGDGTTGRTINCGFTGGARFVCIKAMSTTGSWWTFDSARGITTNADPVLQLNSTAAEITSADAIDTASSGFSVNQETTCNLNVNGVTYLVWAIA